MENMNFSLTCVMVEDPKFGGFTAFFKQLPDIIAEGSTTKEAFDNLTNAIHDVFQFSKK